MSSADNEYDLNDLTRNFRTKLTVCECGCWLFDGKNLDRYGYAKFKIRGKTVIGHRYAYEAMVGPITDGLTVDHLCDRHRNCCNPAHMELVTSLENTLRANARRKAQGGYGKKSGPTPSTGTFTTESATDVNINKKEEDQ